MSGSPETLAKVKSAHTPSKTPSSLFCYTAFDSQLFSSRNYSFSANYYVTPRGGRFSRAPPFVKRTRPRVGHASEHRTRVSEPLSSLVPGTVLLEMRDTWHSLC